MKAIFDELVQLVDPGVEPYKPKRGHPNVIMAVGLQVSELLWQKYISILKGNRATEKRRPARSSQYTTRSADLNPVLSVRTRSVRVHLIKPASPQRKRRSHTLVRIPRQTPFRLPHRVSPNSRRSASRSSSSTQVGGTGKRANSSRKWCRSVRL